jgi:hypothetical protein
MQLGLEIHYPINDRPHDVGSLFMRFDIRLPLVIEDLAKLNADDTIMLWHSGQGMPRYVSEDLKREFITLHISWANQLNQLGFKHLVLAADDDGLLHQTLSPRYSSLDLEQRYSLVLKLYIELKKIYPDLMVLLPIEDLAPDGLDATDGVAIAKALVALGLKEIIATAGTRNFWPLYDRRQTKKKSLQQEDFLSHEPSLASALWLKNIPNLSIWYLAFLSHDDEAIELAKDLGLVGLIKKATRI